MKITDFINEGMLDKDGYIRALEQQIKEMEELTLEAIKHAPTMFEEAYMKRLKALKK